MARRAPDESGALTVRAWDDGAGLVMEVDDPDGELGARRFEQETGRGLSVAASMIDSLKVRARGGSTQFLARKLWPAGTRAAGQVVRAASGESRTPSRRR